MSNQNRQATKLSAEDLAEIKAQLLKEVLEELKGAGPVVGTRLGGGITGGKGKPKNTVSMTFKKRMKRGYFPGDRAGFPEAMAKDLEARGIAYRTPPEVKAKALAKRAAAAAGNSE